MKNKDAEVRCIHRHTIEEHPSCFRRGLISKKYIANGMLEADKEKLPWYKEDSIRIGYLDIESDGLKADFSTMLTWCIKERGGKVVSDVITRKDLFDGDTDKRIVASLLKELAKYDIICTYYGTGFDVPYVRAKALHYDLGFPFYGEIYHHDLYYVVRSKLNLSRKSLDNACDFLNIEGKTPISKNVWRRAKYGDPKAVEEVLHHNVGDVVILEQLHTKLEGHAKWMKRSI